MKVIVTGANGFVGTHLTTELGKEKIETLLIQGSEKGTSISSGYLSLDLSDRRQTGKIDFSGVDGLIHLAGLAAVAPSFDNPMEYINTNMGIEANLFEEALRQKVFMRFLIVSSGSLYDPNAKLPLNEQSAVSPTSPYAVSKLGQEQLAAYYASRGFECIVARPFNHIGPGQGPGFIVPDLASQVLAAKRSGHTEIKVGNLKTKRDYTDVRDIVRAYRLLLEKGKPGETYNICSGRSLSGQEILNGLTEAAGVSLNTTVDQTKFRPADVMNIYGSYEKLHKDTGWQPAININHTLKDVIGSM